jgi:hypothetical protein
MFPVVAVAAMSFVSSVVLPFHLSCTMDAVILPGPDADRRAVGAGDELVEDRVGV